MLKTQQRQGTSHTASSADVRAIKESTRTEGFGQSVNKMIFGLAALGAPVFGPDAVEVVIGLVLPSHLMTAPETRRLGAVLVATADRASHELGYEGTAL